ncbi:Gfo/Idh/MocA family protein [Psychrobacter sp. ER1]|uniref:Gfo/Idh/MocA family protein n=1 Tax=Psychrobacter sp. ER1 TaxID=3406645 RepID=UPI003B428EBF
MNKLAVIGLGSISNRHRKNLKMLYPRSTIFAMSSSGRTPDKLPPDADIIARNIEEVISHNPDMVIVASPSTLHKEHSIRLINAGIPVLIEKPITASLVDANEIIKALKSHQTPVAIGYCLRYLNSSQK